MRRRVLNLAVRAAVLAVAAISTASAETVSIGAARCKSPAEFGQGVRSVRLRGTFLSCAQGDGDVGERFFLIETQKQCVAVGGGERCQCIIEGGKLFLAGEGNGRHCDFRALLGGKPASCRA